jgi:hypothetical protein
LFFTHDLFKLKKLGLGEVTGLAQSQCAGKWEQLGFQTKSMSEQFVPLLYVTREGLCVLSQGVTH